MSSLLHHILSSIRCVLMISPFRSISDCVNSSSQQTHLLLLQCQASRSRLNGYQCCARDQNSKTETETKTAWFKTKTETKTAWSKTKTETKTAWSKTETETKTASSKTKI